MAYGLSLYKADGTLVFDTSSTGFTLVDKFIAATGTSYVKPYPNWTGHTIYACTQNMNAIGGHLISVSGSTVTVTPTNLPVPPAAAASGPSIISVFAR